jgi:COP9 signalosome complex subunit 1
MILSDSTVPKRQKRESCIDIPQHLELESYINNYVGRTKVDRLNFILNLCPGLREVGYPLLIKELVENSIDTAKYQDSVNDYNEFLSEKKLPLFQIDQGVIDKKRQQSSKRQNSLNEEIQRAKNEVDKNQVHTSRMELSEILYQLGNFETATNQFILCRDTATSTESIYKLWGRLVLINLQLKNANMAYTYISRLSTDLHEIDPVIKAKIDASMGISLMLQQKFDEAAVHFTTISSELGSQYNEIISPNDIAIYGTLCSLCSFSRSGLKDLLFNNPNFYQFLELTPKFRDLISHFLNSNYSEVFKILSSYYNDFKLDFFLSDVLDSIYNEIKRRALLQYCAPFTSLKLSSISTIFDLSHTQLIQELTSLIKKGKLQAKLDIYNDVLWSEQEDPRVELYNQVSEIGKDYQIATKATLALYKLNQAKLSIE